MSINSPQVLGVATITVWLALGPPLSGQERSSDRIVPTQAVILTGYGIVGYQYLPADGAEAVPSAFSASVSPVFLFQFQDWILFETELEFELEEGATETGLEYAQADIMVSDNLTLIAGKFLLPIGVFGERLHPSWINKMATTPPIFGHHGTGFGADPLLSIPSDVGLMARGALQAGRWQIGLNGYITNGFRAEEHGAAEEVTVEGEHAIPELVLPGSSEDVTNNKMFGGRMDIALPPFAELNLSAFNGKYDENDELSLDGFGVAGEVRHAGLEFRTEYLQTTQDFEGDDGIFERIRSGLYAQLAYRIADWEPVVRYARLFDDEVEGESLDNGASQLAVGLDYWLSPSAAVMASYEFDQEDGPSIDNDRFSIHMAFGF